MPVADAMTGSKTGWLQKKSGGVFSKWQQRLIDLQATSHGTTITLKTEQKSSRCRQFVVNRAEVGSQATVVVVQCSDGRALQLRAKTEAERDEWLAAFQAKQSTQTQASSSTHEKDSEISSKPAPPRDSVIASSEPRSSLMSSTGLELKIQTFPQGQYVGEFRGGERHGMGRFEYSNGNRYVGSWDRDKKAGFGMLAWTNKDIYTGEWENNKMCGYGCFRFSNGNLFAGMFVSDNKEGTGKFSWSNGDTYEGLWVKDEMSGSGTTRYTNGNVYSGQHKSNVKEGHGRMEWGSGDKFEGDWSNGMIQGEGTFEYTDGGTYKGEWHQDRRHGKGTMQHANGDEYTGEWARDVRHGNGTCQYANADTFVGSFTENLREGFGVYTAAPMRMLKHDGQVSELKGDQYSGNWHQDKKHGFGKYVWADGDVYEGQWHADLRHAEGTCTYANGDKYTGEWQNDMRHGWGRLVWADGNTFEGGWKNDNISPGTKGLVQSGASSRVGSRQVSANPSRETSAAPSPRIHNGQRLAPMPEVEGLQEGASEDWGEVPDMSFIKMPDIQSEVGTWLNDLTGGGNKAARRGTAADENKRTNEGQGRSLLSF